MAMFSWNRWWAGGCDGKFHSSRWLLLLFVLQVTRGQRPWPTWCSGGLRAPSLPPSSCLTAKTLWTPPNWFTRRRWTEWGCMCVCVHVWESVCVCVCVEQLGPAGSYTSSSSLSSSSHLDSRLICLHTVLQMLSVSSSLFDLPLLTLPHTVCFYSRCIFRLALLVLGCWLYRQCMVGLLICLLFKIIEPVHSAVKGPI